MIWTQNASGQVAELAQNVLSLFARIGAREIQILLKQNVVGTIAKVVMIVQ